jgi:hypothetical protein
MFDLIVRTIKINFRTTLVDYFRLLRIEGKDDDERYYEEVEERSRTNFRSMPKGTKSAVPSQTSTPQYAPVAQPYTPVNPDPSGIDYSQPAARSQPDDYFTIQTAVTKDLSGDSPYDYNTYDSSYSSQAYPRTTVADSYYDYDNTSYYPRYEGYQHNNNNAYYYADQQNQYNNNNSNNNINANNNNNNQSDSSYYYDPYATSATSSQYQTQNSAQYYRENQTQNYNETLERDGYYEPSSNYYNNNTNNNGANYYEEGYR